MDFVGRWSRGISFTGPAYEDCDGPARGGATAGKPVSEPRHRPSSRQTDGVRDEETHRHGGDESAPARDQGRREPSTPCAHEDSNDHARDDRQEGSDHNDEDPVIAHR